LNRLGFWSEICIIVKIDRFFIMSKEILEFSVQVDEKFDLKFNWVDGFWGAAFKFFGK